MLTSVLPLALLPFRQIECRHEINGNEGILYIILLFLFVRFLAKKDKWKNASILRKMGCKQFIYQSSPQPMTSSLHRFYLHKGTHMKSKKWYISQFWYCPFKWMSVQWKLMFNRIMKIDKITFQMQVPILNSSEICSAMGLQKGCICICIGCKWHEDCCHRALLWS